MEDRYVRYGESEVLVLDSKTGKYREATEEERDRINEAHRREVEKLHDQVR